MLDHLSGGRLMVGVGRGGALLEHQRYGIDPTDAPAMYHEAFAVLMRAFEADVLDFEGKFYRYKDYVVQAKPVQRPHPPLWYGAPNADAIAWAAPRRVNVVSLGPAERARAIAERYRKEWADAQARAGRAAEDRHHPPHRRRRQRRGGAAHRARPPIRAGATRWNGFGGAPSVDFVLKQIYPTDFAELRAHRPRHRRRRRQPCAIISRGSQRDTGVNYVLCQMVFGDMNFNDASHSIELFAREVMPAFA